MSTINAVPFRSTIFYTAAGVPAATGSVLTIGDNGVSGFTRNLGSTMVSIGASTNQTYNNFTSGSYTTWATSKSAITSANKTVQSANGLYQLVVANTTSNLSLSSDSGITWSTLSGGLPTLTGSAYWSDGAISANGQYITLSMYGGSPWMSADYGRTFALTNQPTPSIWLPLNGSVADSMGLSVVTTPGTVPGYVTINYPGYTAQAVNLANTAGGTATRYIRGTWAGASNFTVSGWVNPQTLNSTYQGIFSAYTGKIAISISDINTLYATIPNGGGTNFTSLGFYTLTLSVNTWYYFTLIFQTNGLCSFYVNNNLIASATNIGGVGSFTTTQFSLGTYDSAIELSFNGYFDDLRITNSVSTYVPIPLLQPNIWLPFENSTADLGSNAITPTVTGSISYVSGVVGLNAVNLANTLGPTTSAPATQYIRGAWSGSSRWTVSFWFNMQSYSTGQSQSTLFSSYEDTILIMIYNNSLGLYTNSGTQIASSSLPAINTWHYVTYIHQNNGLCSLYLNNSLVGTYNNPSALGTATRFSLGTYNAVALYPFNGYIDDFRLYSVAIPYHFLVPQNYRSIALSGTGQYALASATSGWVVGSSDSSKTWSKQAVCVGTQAPASSSLALNHTGQYQLIATGPAAGSVMPNQSGLVASTWSQGGVNWTVSASSILDASHIASNVFNNNISGATVNRWASPVIYTSGTGAYAGSVSTTIQGIGSPVLGEWIQLSSSVPLVFSSYAVSCGGTIATFPKIYYLIGSNDGSTWFPLQFANITTTPFTTTFSVSSNSLQVNVTGIQTLNAGQAGSVTTTSYATSTQAYMYFRMVITHINVGSTLAEVNELYINFSNSVSYSSNYGSTWLNTSRTVSNESVALSASGQYSLSTNSVAPFVRLTLDNTNVDAQGVLAAPTVVGTSFSYDTTRVVGTHSINFANTAGATSSLTYLNYTVPAALYLQNTLTMSCWIYPTANPASGNPCPMGFNNGSTSPATLFQIVSGTNYLNFSAWTTTGGSVSISTTTAVILNTWTHLVGTFSNGVVSFYVNGVLQGIANVTGSLSVLGGTNMTNLFIGAAYTTWGGFRGNVDDVRIYTLALNADEVNGLFKNPALTQTVAVSSSYLPITSYTEPAFPSITAPIVDTAVSQTGQYMVAVTSSTTNNVYYSIDFGATFTALTVGSSAMVSCSISYDGSYLAVENATTLYTLNRNTQGFTVAVGNQTGLINQAQNAIAIGNQAGRTNQSANSIVLNATGAALDAVVPGFYVAPVASAASSSAAPFNLLGYGTDNQIVQSSALTVLQNGNMGIGTANSSTPLTIYSSGFGTAFLSIYGPGSAGNTAGINISPWGGTLRPGGTTTTIWALDDGLYSAHLLFGTAATGSPGSSTVTERMRITSSGLVGIGTNAPLHKLTVYQDGNSLLNEANNHSFSILSNQGTIATNQMLMLLDADYTNQCCSVQSIMYGLQVYNLCLNPRGGNVGIGLTNPSAVTKLDVNGITRSIGGFGTNSGSVPGLTTTGTIVHRFRGGAALLSIIGQNNLIYLGFVQWIGNVTSPGVTAIISGGYTATIDGTPDITIKTTAGTSNASWNITYLACPGYAGPGTFTPGF